MFFSPVYLLCFIVPLVMWAGLAVWLFFPEVLGIKKRKKGKAGQLSKKVGRPASVNIVIGLVAAAPSLFLGCGISQMFFSMLSSLLSGRVDWLLRHVMEIFMIMFLPITLSVCAYFFMAWLYDNYQEHQIKIQQALTKQEPEE